MTLRGGGCGSSTTGVVTPITSRATELKIPSGLVNQIKFHSERIANSVVTVLDSQSNLMNSFQFFQLNSRSFWTLVIHYTNQSVDLIEKSLEILIPAFKLLIKSNIVYSYYISQAISQLSWIMFAFYTTNGERFFELKKQQFLLNEIELIEDQLSIEKNSDKYLNNIQYELFVIKSIIFICPTNSTEGREIIFQFLSGALTALATFSLNKDVIQSIVRGVVYIYQEDQRASRTRKLEVIFALQSLKFSIIEELEKGMDTKLLTVQLSQVYSQIVKESTDWEIWNSWAQVLSYLFSYKPILQNLQLQKSLMDEIEGKEYIIPIADEKSVISFKYQNLSKDKTLRKIFDNSQSLQEQAKLQTIVLQGYGLMHSYEQQYFAKWQPLKDSEKEKNTLPISLITISSLLNIIEAVQQHQDQLIEIIKLLDFQDFQKLKQTDKLLNDSINKTLFLFSEVGHLASFQSQISEFIKQQNLQSDLIFEENDQIQLSYCQVYLDCLKQNKNSQLIDAFKKQHYESIFESMSKRLTNEDAFKQLVSKFKNNQYDEKVIKELSENLQGLNLKKQQKTVKQLDSDCLVGLNYALSLVYQSRQLLKWNLQVQVQLKIGLKTLLVSRKPETAQEITSQLISQSSQLISYGAGQQSIQFLYGQFLTCKNKNAFLSYQNNDSSKLEKILYNLLIEKLESTNLINSILKKNIFKDTLKNLDVRFDQEIFKLLQEQLEANLNFLTQVSSGFKMINDFFAFEIESNSEAKDDLEIILDQNVFYEILQLLQQNLNPFQIETCLQKLNTYYQQFNSSFLNMAEEIKKQDEEFYSQLQVKNKTIRNLLDYIEILSSIKIIKEKDQEIVNNLKKDILKILNDAMQEPLSTILKRENKQDKFSEEIKFYGEIINEVELIKLKQQEGLQKLFEIEKESEQLALLIENYRTFEKLGAKASEYKYQQEESRAQITEAIQSFTTKQPNTIIDCSSLLKILKSKKVIQYKKELESQLYFVLSQIESKEEVNTQSYFYDKIKDGIEEFLSNTQWRIRQAFIFELLQMRNSCFSENTLALSSGLLLKLQTYETDKRIRKLFEDQRGQEISLLMNKYWPSSEQQIQQKIKEKLKELNEIAQQLTVETQPQAKIKLRKEYAKQEKEISAILENVQNIGNQLGVTVIFFQDLKQDLLRIESQIQQLSETMESINKDVKYLKGRSVKELLEIRMKRVLQHRLIVNSDTVYIPIKTQEKLEEEGIEDQETILFTEDLFGNGEINEFIWKQQKESLLIHGQAGSGKSTAARKIEEFLWLVYQKNRNQADYIPLIPIFVSLPQLKDPIYCAVEETLRSDNYRFSDRQIEEFKEAIEQKQFKLIIIMDSYDELKQQYLGLNLNVSNKISKWRCSSDKNKYPKIITTSRSELFTIKGYNSWFLSESNSIKYYKEVRLLKFNEDQIKQYIEEYTFLCVKRIIKEFYFAQNQNQDYQEFENTYNDIIKTVGLLNMKQEEQFMLNQDQIQQLIHKCSNFITTEHSKTMLQMFQEIWSSRQYYNFIIIMNLESVIETPFMIEIVMDVLPYIVKQRQEINNLKEQFIKKYIYYSRKDISIEKQALDEWQGIVNNTEFMQEYAKEFSESLIEKVIVKYFKNNQKLKVIKQALLLEPLSTYDFYVQFLEHYFKRQVHKLRESGEQIDFEQIGNELWEFAHRLANEMTFKNMSQVHFQQSGLIFKKAEKDWRDDFFNDDCQEGVYKRLFRKCIPIKQKSGIYSFNHKSLQEFLVAKWFIEQLTKLSGLIDDEDVSNVKEDILKYSFFSNSWDFEYMQGSIKFILDKIKFNDELKQKLVNFIFLTKTHKQFVVGGSNSFYLLNLMGEQFLGNDFSKIEISNISLYGANFFNCNFTDSKFTRVKLSGVNLNQAKIVNAKWNEIQIDELPKIDSKLSSIEQITYLKDDQLFFVTDGNQIKQYNLYKLSETKKMNIDFKPSISIVSNDGKLLALINNQEILIYDIKGNKAIQKLSYGDCFSQYKLCAAFSPDESSLFLGGSDGVDELKLKIETEEKQIIQYKSKKEIQPKMMKRAKGKADYKNEEDEMELEEEQKKYGGQKEQTIIKSQGDQIVSPDQFTSITDEHVVAIKSSKVIVMQHFSYQFSVYNPQTKASQTIDSNFQRLSAIDINKDSTMIAAGSQAGEINLFYLSQLYQPISLSGHKDNISQVQFTVDGKYLVSCSWDKSIRLWNTQQQTQINQVIFQLKPKVISLCLVTNTFLALTGFADGLIQLWDLESSDQKTENQKGHQFQITCSIFSPDGSMIVSGSYDKTIKIWNNFTGQQIGQNLVKHTQQVTSLAMSQDQVLLCSGGLDGFIYIWDLQTQKIRNEINHYGCQIDSIKVILNSEQQYTIVSQTVELIAHLWNEDLTEYCVLYDYRDENKRRIPALESKQVVEMSKNLVVDITRDVNITYHFLKDQTITAIGACLDGVTKLIGTSKGVLLIIRHNQTSFSRQAYKGKVEMILMINEKYFLTMGDFQITIWKLSDFIVKETLYGHLNQINDIVSYRDTIYSCDYSVKIWNLNQQNKLMKTVLKDNDSMITALCYCSQNNTLFAGTENGRIEIIDLSKSDQNQVIEKAHYGKICKITWLNNTNQFISAGQDCSIKIWENTKLIKSVESSTTIQSMFVSPDENYFILRTFSTLEIWLLEELQFIEQLVNVKPQNQVMVLFNKQQIFKADDLQLESIPIMNKRVKYAYMQETRNHFPEAITMTDSMIITADFSGNLGFWNFKGDKVKDFYKGNEREMKYINISSDQTKIIITFKNLVKIISLDKLEIVFSKDFGQNILKSANFLNDQMLLVTTESQDQQVIFMTIGKNDTIVQNDHIGSVSGAEVHQGTNSFLTYGWDKSVRYYQKVDSGYSCKFAYTSQLRFECQGALLQNYEITSKSKIELTELLKQKKAIIK